MTSDFDQYRRDFDRDGFLILRNFLSPQELQELTKRTESYFSQDQRLKALAEQRSFQGTWKNMQRDDSWFADQLVNGKQAEFISKILDDELIPATAAYFSRIPGEDSGIDPHFDAIGHRSKGATFWVSLDRSTVANGCVYYLKGSHKQWYESRVGLEGIEESLEEAIAIELEPGDASVHSSLLIHWSRPNTSQLSRRGISYFYWAASSKRNKVATGEIKSTSKVTSS